MTLSKDKIQIDRRAYREASHRSSVDDPASISAILRRHPLQSQEDPPRRPHQHHVQVQLPSVLQQNLIV